MIRRIDKVSFVVGLTIICVNTANLASALINGFSTWLVVFSIILIIIGGLDIAYSIKQ